MKSIDIVCYLCTPREVREGRIAIAPHFFPNFSAYFVAGIVSKSALLGLNKSGANELNFTRLTDKVVHRLDIAFVLAFDIDLSLEALGIRVSKGDALSSHWLRSVGIIGAVLHPICTTRRIRTQ